MIEARKFIFERMDRDDKPNRFSKPVLQDKNMGWLKQIRARIWSKGPSDTVQASAHPNGVSITVLPNMQDCGLRRFPIEHPELFKS